MGFLDKAKAGVSNVGSKISESADESSYNSKIRDQERAKAKALEEAGQIMYKNYLEGKTDVPADVKDLFEKAKAADAEAEKLEKEKQEMKEAAHQEREDRRAEVKAKEEKEKAEKEAAKAAAEAEKKE